LGLLFQNLLGNAIKFRNGRNPSILIDSVREGSHWRIGVHDNGPGIEPQHRERIFQIFQRLKRSDEGGTGIGLAICKRIVNRHGGRIWVESAPGEGSSFYFTIPEGSMRSETKPATASPLLTEADADPEAVSHPHDANGRIKQNLETLQA
jgi:signal transduction histidine kinase